MSVVVWAVTLPSGAVTLKDTLAVLPGWMGDSAVTPQESNTSVFVRYSASFTVSVGRSPGFGPAKSGSAAPVAQAAADAANITVSDDDTATELLTRNPDFYAWLGTEEARSLAME